MKPWPESRHQEPSGQAVASTQNPGYRTVPIAYVSKQLGHSSIQVTVDLYGHFQPGADRHHVEGLATALETATQDREEPRAIPHLDFSSSPTTPTAEEEVSRP